MIRTIADRAVEFLWKLQHFCTSGQTHYRGPASHLWRLSFAHPATALRTFADQNSHIWRPTRWNKAMNSAAC